jgi:hypothetical protein
MGFEQGIEVNRGNLEAASQARGLSQPSFIGSKRWSQEAMRDKPRFIKAKEVGPKNRPNYSRRGRGIGRFLWEIKKRADKLFNRCWCGLHPANTPCPRQFEADAYSSSKLGSSQKKVA